MLTSFKFTQIFLNLSFVFELNFVDTLRMCDNSYFKGDITEFENMVHRHLHSYLHCTDFEQSSNSRNINLSRPKIIRPDHTRKSQRTFPEPHCLKSSLLTIFTQTILFWKLHKNCSIFGATCELKAF